MARAISRESGTSMYTVRRDVRPVLSVMTHQCKNRELTVTMAAAYDMDEGDVAFVTGSGESTNKVESIVADAADLRTEAIEEHAGGAFDVPEGHERDEPDEESADAGENDTTDGSNQEEDADGEAQAGLGDFM
jgi:replication factor C large subunit